MNFTEHMIMTVSTRKKKTKKKKRRNKTALFAGVLCGVLLIGTLGLVLLTAAQRSGMAGRDNSQAEGAAGRKTGQAKGAVQDSETAEAQSIWTRIADAEQSLLSDIMSETPEREEETETESAGRYDALLADTDFMKANRIYAKETASGEQTVLAFAGDILFDPNYAVMARLLARGGGIEEAFSEELLARMRGADLFMVNNEFPYSDRGVPTEGKQFTFRAKPESASYLEEMGVDIVSLANNHASDYGEASLLDTLDLLEEMEMPYVGAGRNLEEAKKPACFVMNDKRIAIVSATQIERNDNPDTRGAGETTPGTFRCWNPDNLLAEIKEAKEDNDIVIVYIHWGTENEEQIDWAQRDQAAMIAEAGADLIIGDHPHCLQPVGYVGDVPVIYSLGNFWFNSRTLDTCFVEVTIPAEGEMTVRVLPAKQSDCRTQLLDGAEAQRVISYLNSISETGFLDENGVLSKRQ